MITLSQKFYHVFVTDVFYLQLCRKVLCWRTKCYVVAKKKYFFTICVAIGTDRKSSNKNRYMYVVNWWRHGKVLEIVVMKNLYVVIWWRHGSSDLYLCCKCKIGTWERVTINQIIFILLFTVLTFQLCVGRTTIIFYFFITHERSIFELKKEK